MLHQRLGLLEQAFWPVRHWDAYTNTECRLGRGLQICLYAMLDRSVNIPP